MSSVGGKMVKLIYGEAPGNRRESVKACTDGAECVHTMYSHCWNCERELWAFAVWMVSHGLAVCTWCGQYSLVTPLPDQPKPEPARAALEGQT